MFGSPSPSDDPSPSCSAPPLTSPSSENPNNTKRKRRPAGTPDPDAEVVSLSPRTLLESDRYVCDICNQGFQREQNLQMHRRRHKVPWKLVKRDAPPAGEARKRVFVCPEPSCLHHDPAHALGDLVGIKKHFRRKHSESRQWECARCSKAYAVQSDYKAHLKTCGTRGHFCDCGRVFSRVESFIEHQDTCSSNHGRAATHTPPPGSGARATSSPNPSNDTNLAAPAAVTWPGVQTPKPTVAFLQPDPTSPTTNDPRPHNLELQLSIGSEPPTTPKDDEMEQLRVAIEEKAMADEARRQAQMNVELAEQEFANAKRVRQQARAELDKACVLRDEVAKQINSVLVSITCHECQQELRVKTAGDGETKISDT